jgi:hypothetical protein
VNTVRGIGEIFELPADADNVPEWINLYAPIYHDINTVNSAGDVIFEERYSVSAERTARETVTEKSEEVRERKKRNRIS